jgi:GNAT superfamily N-acetyltransferase
MIGPSPYPPLPSKGESTVERAIFQFNALHVSRLDVKVDGHSEHLFIAILNGSAIGQVIEKMIERDPATEINEGNSWKVIIPLERICQIRMLYVMPVHRHKGVATRLFQTVEQFARREKATQFELCVLKGNTPGRRFWIQKGKFIDDPEREAPSAEYACMVKAL